MEDWGISLPIWKGQKAYQWQVVGSNNQVTAPVHWRQTSSTHKELYTSSPLAKVNIYILQPRKYVSWMVLMT
jgi:hypothetical protein